MLKPPLPLLKKYSANLLLGLGIIVVTLTLSLLSLRLREASTPSWQKVTSGLRPNSKGHLIWIFQPEDCGASQDVVDVLNSAYSKGRSIRAVVGADNASIAEAVKTAYNVNLPLMRIDPATLGRLLRSLGYQSSPIAIVLDSAGQIREIAPGKDATPIALRWAGRSQ